MTRRPRAASLRGPDAIIDVGEDQHRRSARGPRRIGNMKIITFF